MYLAGPGRRRGSVRDGAGGFPPLRQPSAALAVAPSRRAVPRPAQPARVCCARCCPSVQAVPVPGCSALLLPAAGNAPRVTSWQPRLPLQPQPASTVGCLDSSHRSCCSRGAGLGSGARIKPVTWHGHGKALGSFPAWRVCPASAPSQEPIIAGCGAEPGSQQPGRPDPLFPVGG